MLIDSERYLADSAALTPRYDPETSSPVKRGENFWATWNAVELVTTPAYDRHVGNRLEAGLKKIYEVTGDEQFNPNLDVSDPEWLTKRRTLGAGRSRYTHPQLEAIYQNNDALIRSIKEKHPEVPTIDEVRRDAQEYIVKTLDHASAVSGKSGWLGWGEGLIGGFASAIYHEPVNWMLMAINPGATALKRIVYQGLINAGSEAMLEAGPAGELRRFAGVPITLEEMLTNTGFAAGGGAIMQGVSEAGRVANALRYLHGVKVGSIEPRIDRTVRALQTLEESGGWTSKAKEASFYRLATRKGWITPTVEGEAAAHLAEDTSLIMKTDPAAGSREVASVHAESVQDATDLAGKGRFSDIQGYEVRMRRALWEAQSLENRAVARITPRVIVDTMNLLSGTSPELRAQADTILARLPPGPRGAATPEGAAVVGDLLDLLGQEPRKLTTEMQAALTARKARVAVEKAGLRVQEAEALSSRVVDGLVHDRSADGTIRPFASRDKAERFARGQKATPGEYEIVPRGDGFAIKLDEHTPRVVAPAPDAEPWELNTLAKYMNGDRENAAMAMIIADEMGIDRQHLFLMHGGPEAEDAFLRQRQFETFPVKRGVPQPGAIAEADIEAGHVTLGSQIDTVSPQDRAAIVRHELAHMDSMTHEVWKDWHTALWSEVKRDPWNPLLWDYANELSARYHRVFTFEEGKPRIDDAAAEELLADLYAHHYGTGKVPYFDPRTGEDRLVPIPKSMMQVLDKLEERLGIWTKIRARRPDDRLLFQRELVTLQPSSVEQRMNPVEPLIALEGLTGAQGRLSRALERAREVGGYLNKRVVLKAKSGLKAVFGAITDKDWTERVDTHLTPAERTAARGWYGKLRDLMAQAFGEADADRYALAWLLSQQNTSPSGGMLNVLRAADIARGLPTIKQAGVDGKKLVAALRREVPKSGYGAKLVDFIDAELDRVTRTIMGNDPRGGAPAVIDVWANRDIGKIDAATLNWIKKTFGADAAKGLQIDAGLAEAQYEFGSRFYNNLVKKLNKRGYDGGGWTPSQAQAVGWVAMQKMMGRVAEFPEDIFARNTQRVSIGLTPAKGSPLHGRGDIHPAAATRIIHAAAEASGVRIVRRSIGTGAYDKVFEPAFQVDVLGSPEAITDFMDVLGHSLQQTQMIGARPLKSGRTQGITLIDMGSRLADPAVAEEFMAAVHARLPKDASIANGFSMIMVDGKPALRIYRGVWNDARGAVDYGGSFGIKERKLFEKAVHDVAAEKGFSLQKHVDKFDLLDTANNWNKRPDGGAFRDSLTSRGRTELAARLGVDDHFKLLPEEIGHFGTAEGQVLEQRAIHPLDARLGRTKASIEFFRDKEGLVRDSLIRFYHSADRSSAAHELTHLGAEVFFNRNTPPEMRAGITDAHIAAVEAWAGVKNGVWDVAAKEKVARGFERYLYDGVAPTSRLQPIFDKISEWLHGVYTRLKGSAIDVELSDPVREAFGALINRKQAMLEARGHVEAEVDFGPTIRAKDAGPAGEVDAAFETAAKKQLEAGTQKLEAKQKAAGEAPELAPEVQSALDRHGDAVVTPDGRTLRDVFLDMDESDAALAAVRNCMIGA